MKIDLSKQMIFKNIHNDRIEVNLSGYFLNVDAALLRKHYRVKRDRFFTCSNERRAFSVLAGGDRIFYRYSGNAIRNGVNVCKDKYILKRAYKGVIAQENDNFVPPEILKETSVETVYLAGLKSVFEEVNECASSILRRLWNKSRIRSSSVKFTVALSEVESGIDIRVPMDRRHEILDLIGDNLNKIATTTTTKMYHGNTYIGISEKIKFGSWDIASEVGSVVKAGWINGVYFKAYQKAAFGGISLVRIEATFNTRNLERELGKRGYDSEGEFLDKIEILNRWSFKKFKLLIRSEDAFISPNKKEEIRNICRAFLNKDIDELVCVLEKKNRVYVGKNSGLSKYLCRKIPLLEKEGIFVREKVKGAWYSFNPRAAYKSIK